MTEFDDWNRLKQKLDSQHTVPLFKEREIWWCSLGKNIGHEENGKNSSFKRPVVIVKKFNHRLCWAVPLTTQIKDNKHYFHFRFKGQDQCAMLTQMKLIDANRLTDRMGRIGSEEFNNIKKDLLDYLK